MFSSHKKMQMPTPETALPGRNEPTSITNNHYVLNTPLQPPYPDNSEQLLLGLGCFWGAEKRFWSLPGIITTAVGFSAGYTPNPRYEEVCSGQTGHNEVVLVVFDPQQISLESLFTQFWESHNPTQGMRQGNDQGTQYRSGIYYANDQQKQLAEATKSQYQEALDQQLGMNKVAITTEILPATTFYFAEDYHQQYLAKNPNGYCGLGGLGICLSKPE